MKRIIRLFMGLVLITLFSVGFNVSVKAAAVGPRIQVYIKDSTEDGKWKKGSKLSWTIQPILTDTDKSFPDEDGEKFEYTFKLDGTRESTVKVQLITRRNGDTLEYFLKIGDTEEKKVIKNPNLASLITDMDADAVKRMLISDESGNVAYTFNIEEDADKRQGGGPDPVFIGNPVPITAYKVEAKSKSESEPCDPSTVYLLPGEETTIKAPDVIINRTSEMKDYPVYRFTSWTAEGESVTVDGNRSSAKVTMSDRSPGQGIVRVGYGNVNLWFEPEISTATFIKPGGNKTVKIKEISEGCDPYTANDVVSVTLNGNILTPGDQWAWSGGSNGTFQFSVPSNTATSREAELLIEMTDGNKFKRTFTVGDEPVSGYTVTVTPIPATGGIAKASPTSGDTGTEVQLTATPNDGYTFNSWDVIEGGVKISDPNKQTTSFVIGNANVVIAAKFSNDYGDEYTVTLTADPSDGGKVLVKNATSGEIGTQGSTSTVTGFKGDSIIIRAIQGNSEFEKWEVRSGGVTLDDPTELDQDFVLGSGNVKITALYSSTPDEYAITVKNDGHGIGVATPSSAQPGKKVTLQAYSADGYIFKEWVTTDDILLANAKKAKTTFIMPQNPVTVKAVFKKASTGTSIKNAKVELSKSSFTYNGKKQKPTIRKVTVEGKTLKKGTDYSVKWSDSSSLDAGKYTITLTGKGTYSGKKDVTYTIKKASNPLKVSAKHTAYTISYSKLQKKSRNVKETAVYDISKKGKGSMTYVLSVAERNGKSYKGKFKVDTESGRITVKKGLKKGSYNIVIKVKAAGTGNYKAATKKVSFTIAVK